MKKILKKILNIHKLEDKHKRESTQLLFENVNKIDKTLSKVIMKNIEGSNNYYQK